MSPYYIRANLDIPTYHSDAASAQIQTALSKYVMEYLQTCGITGGSNIQSIAVSSLAPTGLTVEEVYQQIQSGIPLSPQLLIIIQWDSLRAYPSALLSYWVKTALLNHLSRASIYAPYETRMIPDPPFLFIVSASYQDNALAIITRQPTRHDTSVSYRSIHALLNQSQAPVEIVFSMENPSASSTLLTHVYASAVQRLNNATDEKNIETVIRHVPYVLLELKSTPTESAARVQFITESHASMAGLMYYLQRLLSYSDITTTIQHQFSTFQFNTTYPLVILEMTYTPTFFQTEIIPFVQMLLTTTRAERGASPWDRKALMIQKAMMRSGWTKRYPERNPCAHLLPTCK